MRNKIMDSKTFLFPFFPLFLFYSLNEGNHFTSTTYLQSQMCFLENKYLQLKKKKNKRLCYALKNDYREIPGGGWGWGEEIAIPLYIPSES